jgi:hypothetical protein
MQWFRAGLDDLLFEPKRCVVVPIQIGGSVNVVGGDGGDKDVGSAKPTSETTRTIKTSCGASFCCYLILALSFIQYDGPSIHP